MPMRIQRLRWPATSKKIQLGVGILGGCEAAVHSARRFYRAMHFSAKRGMAIACRLSVCLSVCPSVCPPVTLVDCDHIGWNSSKIIPPLVSLGCSLFATPT